MSHARPATNQDRVIPAALDADRWKPAIALEGSAPDRSLSGATAISGALQTALAGMPPGWTVLQDTLLPGENSASPIRIGTLLVHPGLGIAVLDVVPGPNVSDAARRLRQALEADGFVAAFGCLPPVVYLCMPIRELSGLEAALGQAFGQQPPIALQGGAAWVGAVQRRLGAVPLAPLPGSMVGGGLALARLGAAPEGHRAAHPRSHGLRALIWFWGVLLAGAGTGIAVLQYLGPPEHPASQARAATEPARLPVPEEERARDLLLVPTLQVPGPVRVPAPVVEASAATRQDLPAPPAAGAPSSSEATPSENAAAAVADRDQAEPNSPVSAESPAPDPVPPEPVQVKAPVPNPALHDTTPITDAPLPVWGAAAAFPDAALGTAEADAEMPTPAVAADAPPAKAPPARAPVGEITAAAAPESPAVSRPGHDGPPTRMLSQSDWGQEEPSPDKSARTIAAAPPPGAIVAATAVPPSAEPHPSEAPPPVPPAAAEALIQHADGMIARNDTGVVLFGANVRADPSADALVLRTIGSGTYVRVFARRGGWLKVGDSTPWGWVHVSRTNDLVGMPSFDPPSATSTDTTAEPARMARNSEPAPDTFTGYSGVMVLGANVRADPSADALVLRTIGSGTHARVFARRGEWLQVGGSKPWGWVHVSRTKDLVGGSSSDPP